MVWMSRTGDYGNFSVEKASGTVTDDSAVALAFVSRKQFKILHLIASTDLIVLTAGNEWTLRPYRKCRLHADAALLSR